MSPGCTERPSIARPNPRVTCIAAPRNCCRNNKASFIILVGDRVNLSLTSPPLCAYLDLVNFSQHRQAIFLRKTQIKAYGRLLIRRICRGPRVWPHMRVSDGRGGGRKQNTVKQKLLNGSEKVIKISNLLSLVSNY